MIAIFAVVLIILNIIKPKLKITYYTLLFFMWIIMSFTYHISDETIYISRYYSPNLWQGQSEILFSLSIIIFNRLGFSFIQYKAAMSAVILALFSSTIRRYAKYPNLVLLLYFLCPFALNVAQFRNALATAVFIYGSRFLLDVDHSKIRTKIMHLTKNDLLYIGFVMLAAMFHTAATIWMLLLVAKKCSIKTNIIVMAAVNFMVAFVLTPSNILCLIPSIGAVSRMAPYLSEEYQQSEWRHYSQILWVLFIGAITLMFAFLCKNKKEKVTDKHELTLFIKENIIILSILGVMFRYTQEVYRLQEGLSILNYIFITNAITNRAFNLKHISKWNFKAFGTAMAYSVGLLYLEILHYLIPSIVVPILNNNYLFDLFH